MSIFDQVASIVASDFVSGQTVNQQYQHPQRTWVGLTDEEKNSLWDRAEKRQAYQGVPALMALIQEVEAKLKEKNT